MTESPVIRRVGDRIVWRAGQFFSALAHRHNPEIDRELRGVMQNEAQWALLLRLSAFDRAHHLMVYNALTESGHSDADLLLAAALHDVGKADTRGRVRLAHRVLKVVLQRVSLRLLDRIARREGSWLRHGVYLARHHTQLGAHLALAAGASYRCSELIARHEDRLPVDDPQLQALMQADSEAIA